MHNKIYLSPEFEVKHITLRDVLLSSVESFTEVIDGPGDQGDPTFPDPDDDEIITW